MSAPEELEPPHPSSVANSANAQSDKKREDRLRGDMSTLSTRTGRRPSGRSTFLLPDAQY